MVLFSTGIFQLFWFSCHLKAKIRGHGCNNNMRMAACFERLVPDFPVGVRGLTELSIIHSLI